MKSLFVAAAMASVAVMSMTGCADLEPTTDTRSESIVIVGEGGEEITVTITFDASVTVGHVEDLLTNIAVVEGEGVSVVDSGLQGLVPVPAADPHWGLDEHAITVEVNIDGMEALNEIPDRRWEWIDVSQLEEFCPPGH